MAKTCNELKSEKAALQERNQQLILELDRMLESAKQEVDYLERIQKLEQQLEVAHNKLSKAKTIE